MAANNLKIAMNLNPGNTLSTLYSPSGVQCVGNLKVCNSSASYLTFGASLRPNGGSDSEEQRIAWNLVIGPNESMENGGIALASGDTVRVIGSTADVSFTFTGQESPTGG